MPIVRTYSCAECNHWLTVTLTMEQVDDPPPDCPMCAQRTAQEFKPFGITGSTSARAHSIAEEIATTDYHAADFQREHRQDGTPKVRYKDETPGAIASTWQKTNAHAALEQAVAIGRQTRIKHGSGLDILQANLRSGAEPDLIANSKARKMIKLW
jgi:hypothetical protein